MPPRRTLSNAVVGLAPAVAALGFVAALVSLGIGPELVAVIVLSGVLFPLTRVVFGRVSGPEDQAFLLSLLLWAIGARFLAFGVIRGFIDPILLAPDAISYEQGGWALVQSWQGVGPGLPARLQDSLQVAHYYVNAGLFAVFGRVPEAVATVNLFLSVWTVTIMYRLARIVAPDRPAIAKVSAILFAFFPSIVLWSVLNIREAPMIFLLTGTILVFLRLQHGRSTAVDVPLLIGLVGAMVFYRQYMAAMVASASMVGLAIAFSRSPVRALAVGVGVTITVAFAGQSFGLGDGLAGDLTTAQTDVFSAAQMLREDMARGAGSAFVADSDVSSLGGALSFLPVGLSYFLFAPFPWALGSLLQVITLPEMLIWYALVPFGLVGVIHSVRRRLTRTAVPLMVIGAVTFSYALVQGNVGTAYRHRAQILPLLFVMVATGLVIWMERRRARRLDKEARRRRARDQFQVPSDSHR